MRTSRVVMSSTLLGCLFCVVLAVQARPQQSAPAGQSASASPQQAQQPQQAQPPRGPHVPTQEEILLGEYGPYRANNDLLYYHLDIRVDPEKKMVSGKNTIRFRMLKDDNRIQIDLHPNLNVDKILFGTTPLKYKRQFRAGVHRFSRDAGKRKSVLDRFLLLGNARAHGAIRRVHVRTGSGRAAVDLHGVRRRRREHLVAG